MSVLEPVLAERKKKFQKACKCNGLRRTPQKSIIFEILASTHTHPTAHELYTEVKKHFPTLSFATVYKNITLFAKNGIIKELDFGEGYKRYDADITDHHHIYYSQTKIVQDVFLPSSTPVPIPTELQNIPLKKIHITYTV